MSWFALSGSIEQGLAYGVLALGVYLTFRVLQFADLTVDGSFPLGAAVAATLIVSGTSPIVAILVAFFAGMLAGAVTGLMHTKMRIAGLLASILTMTALYSVNLRIMGRPNVPLLRQPTLFTNLSDWGFNHPLQALIVFGVLVVVVKLGIDWFLSTEIGLAMRATGDNPAMIRSLGVDTDGMIVLGLAFSNGLVALAGAMMAQYQGYADVGMGLGTIITGLASVILGHALIRPSTVFRATLGAVIGAVLYRLAIYFALGAGFAPTDLRIVTAAIVVLALAGPALKERFSSRKGPTDQELDALTQASPSGTVSGSAATAGKEGM
ncbi:MAG: ABC transporter permease [Firmicutes bacterium ZCTH02-B6]|nr:MAG: ABC transporter permease [Firmicutes bacterium ZCTH02-B6]